MEDEEDLVDVRLLELRDAGSFWGCEVPGEHTREETARFVELSRQIKAHFTEEQHVTGRVSRPVVGHLYIGRHPQSKQWERVRVVDVLTSKQGTVTTCFHVDSADTTNIHVQWLREAPEAYKRLRHQARLFLLDNLTPLTMVSDPDTMETKLEPTDTWDESAKTEVKTCLRDHTRLRARIVHSNADTHALYIRLWIHHGDKGRCLNDHLVNNQYATRTDGIEKDSHPRSGVNTTPSPQITHSGTPQQSVTSPRFMTLSPHQNPTSSRQSPRLQSPATSPSPTLQNMTSHIHRKSPPVTSQNTNVLPRRSPNVNDSAIERPGSTSPRQKVGLGRSTLLLEFIKRNSPDRPGQPAQSPPTTQDPSSSSVIDSRHGYTSDTSHWRGKPSQVVRDREPQSVRPISDVEGGVRTGIDRTRSGHYSSGDEGGKRRSIYFSDTDHVYSPSKGPSDPSPEARPNRSILKKSSSYQSNESDSGGDITPRTAAMATRSDTEDSDGARYKPRVNIDGSALLASLSGGRGELYADMEQVQPDTERVFYSGVKPSACQRFLDVSFGDTMKLVLAEKESVGPRKVQTFAWRPIQMGVDLVAIATRDEGKTLTYLLPLVTQLHDSIDDYRPLPPGNGPRVVILSSSWRLASHVLKLCERVISMARSRARARLIYGHDDSNEFAVLNGCDVLVATPHCLLRMVERKSLSLKRLCHLVLDDADTLCEVFTKPVTLIMSKFREQKQPSANRTPNQVLAFARTWTPALGVFAREHMCDPTVIITSLTEAAIFGRVKMVPVVSESNQRVTKVVDMCDGTLSYGGKIVVIAGSCSEAEILAEHLKAADGYVLLAHDKMVLETIANVEKEWQAPHDKKSPPTLVTTDACLNDMSIMDAKVVIHFQPPGFDDNKVWLMGRRLWLMKQHFVNAVATQQADPQCQSYLIITASLGAESKSLRQLLQRTGTPVPPLLHQLADRALAHVEKDKSTELCHNLKAFGKCRDETRCKMRHLVFDSLDGSGCSRRYIQKLPTEGVVKVLITHAKTASFLYGRLLEHQPTRGKPVNLAGPHTKLCLELGLAMRNEKNRQQCHIPELRKLYAVQDKQTTWHRVETVWISAPGSKGVSEHVHLYYLDRGHTEYNVSRDDLHVLPEKFHDVPFQAVELYVCRVKPLDNDLEWTPKSERVISDTVFNKELHGHVVLSLGNSLWVDPLVERERLSAVNMVQNSLNVRTKLITEGHGEPNNQHLHRLYELCSGRIDLPEMYDPGTSGAKAYTPCGMPIIPEVCQLRMRSEEERQGETWDDGAVWQHAYISSVASPNLVYLQLVNTQRVRDELRNDIELYLKYNLEEQQGTLNLQAGTLVLAKYPFEDNEWQRAKVVEITSDGRMDIFFVDTGEQEYISKEEILPIRSRFLNVPFQAIECNLMHVEPPVQGEDWGDEVSDLMWQFTRQPGTDMSKPVYVTVVTSSEARCTGKHKYGVELNVGSGDVSSGQEYGVDLAELLVANNLAKLTPERISKLFPVGLTSGVTQEYRKIPTLCSIILSEISVRDRMAQQVFEVVKANQKAARDMVGRGLVTCLVTVVSHVWQREVVEPLCRALYVLIYLAASCLDSTASLRLANQLCMVLEQCNKPIIQRVLQPPIKTLAESGQLGHSSLLEHGLVRILCKLIQSSQNLDTKMASLKTLSVVVKDLQSSDICYVTHSACLPVLCECLQSPEPISKHALACLEKLAAHTALKDAIRKHEGIKHMCSLLNSQQQSVELHESCIRCLKLVASNNRFNKDHMHELKLTDLLKKVIKASRVCEGSIQLCHDLYNRLLELRQSDISTVRPLDNVNSNKEKKTGVLDNMPLPKQRIDEYNEPLTRACPEVRWSQNKWNLLLLVDVRDARKDKNILTLTSSEIRFRAVAHSVEYTFNFTLYDLVGVEESEMRVKSSHVQIGLRKQCTGRWPRLLKAKSKPPSFLHVDHDRYADTSSGSDSEEDDKENRRVPRPLDLATRNVHRLVPFTAGPSIPRTDVLGPDADTDSTEDDRSDPEEYDDVGFDRGDDMF